jgi:hypothetical protein
MWHRHNLVFARLDHSESSKIVINANSDPDRYYQKIDEPIPVKNGSEREDQHCIAKLSLSECQALGQ